MAKFCSECGRPLEEGEICHCTEQGSRGNDAVIQADDENNSEVLQEDKGASVEQENIESSNQSVQNNNANTAQSNNVGQNAQGQNNYQNTGQNTQGQNYNQNSAQKPESEFSKKSKNFFAEIKKVLHRMIPILKSPVKEINHIINTDDKMGFYMIITHIIAMTLAVVILEEGALNSIFYSRFLWRFDYSVLKLAISSVAFIGAVDFALAGILLFVTKVIFNYDTNYRKMMTIVGGMAVINTETVLGGALISIIFRSLGTFIALLGMALSVLVLVFAYSENVKLEADKKVYALLSSFALLVIIAANLVYFVF